MADICRYPYKEPATGLAIEFSAKDRDDATRLLTLIAGSSAGQSGECAHDPVIIAQAILADRKRRLAIFNGGMFGEPAWDILLTLFVVDHDGPRLTIGRLIQLTGGAPTTALRWLEYLEDQGLIARYKHPTDARASIAQLTDKARQALVAYLSGTVTPRL